MNLFYLPEINNPDLFFDEEESRHCVKVLRLKEGDLVDLTDGKGGMYKGTIIDASLKRCSLHLNMDEINKRERDYYLHIAIAPPKNPARMEWFLEKATEIGISEITPIICDHSERMKFNTGRYQKIIISAMKQSLQSWLPVINEPRPIRNFLDQQFQGQKFIASCETGKEAKLRSLFRSGIATTIMIGPEGDFSVTEIKLAQKAGFVPVNLGKNRLRTETAGIVSCTIVGIMNQEK